MPPTFAPTVKMISRLPPPIGTSAPPQTHGPQQIRQQVVSVATALPRITTLSPCIVISVMRHRLGSCAGGDAVPLQARPSAVVAEDLNGTSQVARQRPQIHGVKRQKAGAGRAEHLDLDNAGGALDG